MKRSWERLAWLTLAVVLCVAVIQTAGAATKSSGAVKAAYNARTGQLRILTKSSPKVRKGEKALTWSKVGPVGPQGLAGPAGPTGAIGPAGPVGRPGILIPGPSGIADVGPPEFQRAISAGFVLMDVRTAAEYESGHIPGAANISITDLPAAIPTLDTTKPIAVYCGSGKRSAQARDLLRDAGCTSIVNLTSGLATWSSAGGRVVPGPGQGTW